MIYGEIAMLLEREGVRNENTSRALYQCYEARLLDPQDSSVQALVRTASLARLLLQAGSAQGIQEVKEMDETRIIGPMILTTLVQKRGELVEDILQQQDEGENLAMRYDCPYAEPLVRFLRKVRDAGHLEAYNYYLLRMGSRDGFEKWYADQPEKLYAFSNWFEGQPLVMEPGK